MSEKTEGLRKKLDTIVKNALLRLTQTERDSSITKADSPWRDGIIENATRQALRACKDDGLVFLESRGSYGFEAEFEQIEI